MELRPGRPDDADDAAAFAEYAEHAAGGLWTSAFGRRAPTVLGRLYRRPAHHLSHAYVTFACDAEGRRLGMLSGFDGAHAAETGGATTMAILRSAGLALPRAMLLAACAGPLITFVDRLALDEWYIQMVAVSPDARGRGIGSILLDEAQRRAHETGCVRLALDVDVQNTGAIRLYERLGYAITASSRRATLLDGAQVHRMVRPL